MYRLFTSNVHSRRVGAVNCAACDISVVPDSVSFEIQGALAPHGCAGDAQSLFATFNNSVFNVADERGPWLGGLAVAAGFGWTSAGWVGSGLALAAFAAW
jgi:predicted MFS family arabinose efflux permease